MSNLPAIATVARREYLVRVRTRSFVLGTVILVLAIAAVALLPVITRYIDRTETQKIGVYVVANDIAADPVTSLAAILNAPAGQASPDSAAPADFSVTAVVDLARARQDVVDGRLAAVLAIDRGTDGELRFTLYSDDPAASRTALPVDHLNRDRRPA